MDIILFTGFSASGKSTIASEVNKLLQLQYISERKILHNIASSRGFERTRHWLANESLEVILEAARAETVQRMREQRNSRGTVIDGSYDCELPLCLRRIFPEAILTTIFISLGPWEREQRMIRRLGGSAEIAGEEQSLIDGFKLRAGVGDVIKGADIVIDNSGTLEDSVRNLRQELERRRIGGFNPESGLLRA